MAINIKSAAYNDFDRVYDNLFVGAYPNPVKYAFTRKFDVLVLAAAEMQPAAEMFAGMSPGTEIIRAGLIDDELTARQELAARMAAQAVVERLKAGKSVLVTCAMGVNRSAFVAALALVMLTGRPGWWAVNHLRATRRPRGTSMQVLSNSDYAGYLIGVSGVKSARSVS